MAAFQALNSGGGRSPVARDRLNRRRRIYATGNGVYAVEGASQDEIVIGIQFLKPGSKGAIVDEATCVPYQSESTRALKRVFEYQLC